MVNQWTSKSNSVLGGGFHCTLGRSRSGVSHGLHLRRRPTKQPLDNLFRAHVREARVELLALSLVRLEHAVHVRVEVLAEPRSSPNVLWVRVLRVDHTTLARLMDEIEAVALTHVRATYK